MRGNRADVLLANRGLYETACSVDSVGQPTPPAEELFLDGFGQLADHVAHVSLDHPNWDGSEDQATAVDLDHHAEPAVAASSLGRDDLQELG